METNNKDCQHFDSIFLDYIQGKTSDEDSIFVKKHYKTCSNCRANQNYADIIFTWKTLDKWSDVQPSKDFMSKLQHKIALMEEKKRIFWLRVDYFFSIPKIPLAIIVVSGILFISSNTVYAGTNSKLDFKNTVQSLDTPQVKQKLKKFSEMKVNDFLEDLAKNLEKTERKNFL